MIANKTQQTEGLLSMQKLIGTKVENPRGEGLGRIEDVMVGAEKGQIVYAVVSFGGVLSLGNKLFAFPWSALHVDGPRKKVILDLDKEALAQARGFDKEHWPDASDWKLRANVPSPSPAAPAVPERAAVSGTHAGRGETKPPGAPAHAGSPAIATAAPAKGQLDYWGETWVSHGLDRS